MATAVSNTSMVLGLSADVTEFSGRIKNLMRGGDKLTVPQTLALAQFAMVTGLNPFIGECWFIPGSGPMVGIAGARRKDQEMARERGGYSWTTITPVSAEEAGAPPAELKDVAAAFKAEISDSAATREYQKFFAETIQTMREAGVEDPFSAAKEVCGPRPMWVGYGYSRISEQSRMNKTQLARKRAEADALKKRIVIPFGAGVAETDAAPDYYVEAEEVPSGQTAAETRGEISEPVEYGDVDRDFPPDKPKTQEQRVMELTGEKPKATTVQEWKQQFAKRFNELSAQGLKGLPTIKGNASAEDIQAAIAAMNEMAKQAVA